MHSEVFLILTESVTFDTYHIDHLLHSHLHSEGKLLQQIDLEEKTYHSHSIAFLIPFQKHIRFYMELYSHERTPGLSYARIGYHYARPGLNDDHLAIMPEDLRHLELPERWKPANRMGARNSVFYEAEQIIRERIHTRMDQGRLWSGARLLTWYPRNPGESKVALVNIDDKSIRELGQWPWPRHIIAEMISILKNNGAKFIGLDVVFREKEQNPGIKEIKELYSEIQEDHSRQEKNK